LGGFANRKQEVVFAMKHILEAFVRITLFALIILLWLWVLNQQLSPMIDISIIVGGILLIFPVAWLGRKMLDKNPTTSRVAWTTAFVHYAVVILSGVAVVRAIKTHQDWSGWLLPVPTEIGSLLVIITGGATLATVINLAVKGLGAPFAIALSRKLAVDWLYAWTRNPMVLASLAFGLSLGVWFQSILFVLWVLILFAPALLFIVKVYEERELEIRFGESYLEYRSKTPMLFPRKPSG
jgi:protein-S-isoprenylcysteine O-methyltransferase Ste14